MTNEREENIGELFIFAEAIVYSLFPLIIHFSSSVLPAIQFAALSTLLASVVFFVHLFRQGQLSRMFGRDVFPYLVGVTLLIVVFPSLLIYPGTALTSGANTALLLDTEIVFSAVFMAWFFGERMTRQKFIGTLIVSIGVGFVLYQGSFSLTIGDAMILLGSAFYPFGNFCAKKALQRTSPSVVLLFRSFFGGMILLMLSFLLETSTLDFTAILQKYWYLFVLNGFVIMAFSKVLWYEGIRRIEISKAKALTAFAPALSLVWMWLFLNESISSFQWIGGAFIIFGVLVLTRKRSNLIPAASI